MLTGFALENYGLLSALEAALIFSGMLLCMELGRRLALRRGELQNSPGAGAIEGAVFALLGLLMAFTFAGAAGRVWERNQAAIAEANAIGTAYLRLDLLPKPAGKLLKAELREYTAARAKEYADIRDKAAFAAARAKTAEFRGRLWAAAAEACRVAAYPSAALLVLPAFNDSFDAADRRELMRNIHPPQAVYLLMFGIALLAALLAGYRLADKSRRSWLHRASFAAATALTIFVTLNLEYPLLGVLGSETLRAPLEALLLQMR
jgi:hypothetical protein